MLFCYYIALCKSPTRSAAVAVDSATSVTVGAAAVLVLSETSFHLVSACSGLSTQTVFEIARLHSPVNLKWSMAVAQTMNSGSVACAAQVG